MGGCSQRVRLLHHIGSGVDSKADKASHVERLHNAVPAVPPEPLIIPRHILASRYDVWLITLQCRHHRCSLCWQHMVAWLARINIAKIVEASTVSLATGTGLGLAYVVINWICDPQHNDIVPDCPSKQQHFCNAWHTNTSQLVKTGDFHVDQYCTSSTTT